MTGEPDKPGRRPPTIELKATEVGSAPSAASNPSSSGDAGASKPASESAAAGEAASKGLGRQTLGRNGAGRLKSHAISAGVGAVAMAAIVAALWLKGFI